MQHISGYNMARISPVLYKPILSYHFKVQFLPLDMGEFVIDGKGTELPAMSNNIIVADHGNAYLNIKGKTRWNPLKITLYTMSGITATTSRLWRYLNMFQDIKSAKDSFRDLYAMDVRIHLLEPNGSTIGTWTLVNAIASEISWGTMDWSQNDIVTADVSFVYDYAEYS